MQLQQGNSVLDLTTTRIMGILNVTPDSFSDGGLYLAQERAIERALQMVAEGADIIDVGGESTRPGAEPVSAAVESERVVSVIQAIRRESSVPISIDTSKADVMRSAVNAGATMINDVRALSEPGAIAAAVESGVAVCLMHMQGQPGTMQAQPQYTDVIVEVRDFLLDRVKVCLDAGIRQDQILIDPGFGFGKALQHNLDLLRNLDVFTALGIPVLVGLSRKSMIAGILAGEGMKAQVPAEDRLAGSVTLALYAARKGAHIVRVHDVRQTVEALLIQRTLK